MLRFDPDFPRKHLRGHLLWFLGWLFVTVVGLILTPSPAGHGTHTQLGLPPCPSVLFYQRPCPGCGLTSSFTALLHLRIGESFADHPFGPLFYLLWTLSAFACLYGFLKGMRFNTDGRAWSYSLGALTLVFFAYGVWRFTAVKYPLSWAQEQTAPYHQASR